jgi:hypothetical protein
VNDQVHGPRLVEETFGDQPLLGGQGAEQVLGGRQVVHHLLGRAQADAVGLAQGLGDVRRGLVGQPRPELFPDGRHLLRQLHGAARRFAQPKGHRRRQPRRALHPHAPGLDPPNAPGAAAEEEHVSGRGLDGPIFIDGADHLFVGLEHHRIHRGLGDGPARGQGQEPGVATPSHHAVDPIPVDVGALPTPGRDQPFAEHGQHLVEGLAAQVAVRVGPLHHLVEGRGVPIFGGRHRHQLLGQHVDRLLHQLERVEVALLQGAQERQAFDQLIPGEGPDSTLRHPAQGVSRTAHPLEQDRDVPR